MSGMSFYHRRRSHHSAETLRLMSHCCNCARRSEPPTLWKFLVPYVEAQHNFLYIIPVGLLNPTRWVVTANDSLHFRISAFSWVHELFKCCCTHIFFMLMYLLNNHVELYITMECLSYIVYLSRFLLHPHQRQVWRICSAGIIILDLILSLMNDFLCDLCAWMILSADIRRLP